MTRTTNARVAGFTFLFYIAVAMTSMTLFTRATSAEGITEKFALIAQHATEVRLTVLLDLLSAFAAVVLGVTLYALTRDEDLDLAMLGMVCRVGEGVIIGAYIPSTLSLLWLATTPGTVAPDTGAAHLLGSYLLRGEVALPATFFAAGSAFFSYLFLRGRMIPVPLAWLGVAASALLVIVLPLRLAGFLAGPISILIWLPMLVFEVWLGLRLIVKGLPMPVRTQSDAAVERTSTPTTRR